MEFPEVLMMDISTVSLTYRIGYTAYEICCELLVEGLQGTNAMTKMTS